MVEIRKKEWAVDLKGKKLCVSVPLWLKLKTVVFNGPPKSRSRAVARLVMLAAWASLRSTGLQSLGVAGRRWEDRED